jgi:hypothetical protein
MEDSVRTDLREIGWEVWTGCIWLRIDPMAGSCERGNEPAGSVKGGEFLDCLSDWWLLKKDCPMELIAFRIVGDD